MGWTRYNFGQIAAGYFVKEEVVSNSIAVVTGYIADYILAMLLGVVIVYVFRIMGRDYAVFKGLLFGGISYIFLYGVAMALNFTRVSLLTPLPNLVLLVPHVVFGATAAWAVKYLMSKNFLGGE